MSARLQLMIALLLVVTIPSLAQFNTQYKDISSRDLIDALQFAGIDIFKFNVDSLQHNYDFFITVDEYDSTHGLRRIDTLLAFQTQYDRPSDTGERTKAYIDRFRFITKVLNNKYDTIYLHIGTDFVSTWRTLQIAPLFARKHYWVRFRDQQTTIGKSIPLLFYGSEWTETIDGAQTTRFCSRAELDSQLNDPTIKLIPHYFIIGYMFLERR